MDPDRWRLILIIIIVLLVILSAFISLADTAFLSMSRGRLRLLVDDEVPGAVDLSKLMDDQENVYMSLTVGDTIVNVAAATLGSYWLNDLFIFTPGIKILISTGIMVLIILIFADTLPEIIARRYPEKISLFALKPIKAMLVLLRPFVVTFYGLSKFILRIFGFKQRKDEPNVTREELKTLVDVSVEEGVLDLQEKELIDNVTEFGELRVGDVMTQRSDMVCVPEDISFEALKEIILNEKYSRMPVYRDTTDDILGILHIKDMLFVQDAPQFKVTDHLRPAYFTYEFKLVSDLFLEMRKNRTHIAVVFDEYGGTAGLVTIEDFLEEIVGEIDDEYDDEPVTEITKISPDVYEMDASTHLADINDELGLDIESEDVDSIGGFIIGILGTFPVEGQIINWEGMDFLVTEVEKNKVNKVRIILKDKAAE